MQLYADIVLPLAQPVYTFAVPGGTDVAAGQAVAVQFGARKFFTKLSNLLGTMQCLSIFIATGLKR